jgi:diguanylate cyclase (GGDEF)-like protein
MSSKSTSALLRLNLGPAPRISLGLVILTACLLITADVILGLVPDEASAAFSVRKRSSENLAIQLSPLAQRENFDLINHIVHAVNGRNPDVLSMAVRTVKGDVPVQTEGHVRSWVAPPDNKSTMTSVIAPMRLNGARWGQLEVAYRPLTEKHAIAWLNTPSVMLSAIMCSVGFLLFYLYLRRILRHMDPNAAIPDRVRTAFDSLSESVVVIDKQDKIVLANSSFRALHPEAAFDLTGKKISDLDWLTSAVGGKVETWPWQRAMHGKATVSGETITIGRDGDAPLKLTVNSAPIMDERKQVRGCLITLDDLSLIEHMNEQLLDTVAQLEVAKSHIEERNRDLKYMADHDQLSAALTRRAFLERAQQQFSIGTGQRAEGSCLRVDIDHFKSINDRYGHLVGDQAIQRVAAILQETVGEQDLVCRYGGEEFCVLVAGSAKRALEVAEKFRHIIETTCGPALIHGEAARITASFGMSSLESGATTLTELIKQADEALYLAKGSGRNRVCRYDEVSNKPRGSLAA